MSTLVKAKPSVSKGAVIKWLVCILLPIIILLLPVTGAFTPTIRSFIAISIFLIALIATEAIPIAATALLIPVAYIILLKVPATVAFQSWSQDMPWLVICGYLVSYALQKTGLMKRLSYICLLAMGGKFVGIIYGFMIIGTVLSLIIPGPIPKCVLMATLAVGMCNVLKLKMGGKSSSAIGLCVYVAMLNPGFFFYHGSQNNLVPMSVIQAAGFAPPSWGAYFLHMFVPELIFTLVCCLVIQFLFKPDEKIETKEFLRAELAELGKMSKDEKKVAVVAVLLVVAIILSGVHGISVGWLFVLATIVMLLPGVRLVTPQDFKQVNLPFAIFTASCLSIGVVSAYLGVGEFLATLLEPMLQGSSYRSIGGTWLFGFLANFALSPLAAYSAFTGSIANIAQNLGINYLPMVYTYIQSLEQVLLPYEFTPILILFGYGMISFKNMVKFSAIKSVLSIICILAVYMTWWKIIGLL